MMQVAHRQKGLLALLIAVGALLVAGCGSSSSSKSSAGGSPGSGQASKVGQGKTIGVIALGDNVFNNCYVTGVLQGLKNTGYKTVLLSSKFTPNQEIANFQTLVSQQVNGIVVFPDTAASAGRGAIIAQQAHIPVVDVAWNSPSSGDKAYVARLQPDSVVGAKLVADWLAKNSKPGEIILVDSGVGDPSDNAFRKAFPAALHPGWKLVGTQGGFYARDKAITAFENLETAHPNARIVVDFAAEMGNGIASSLALHKQTNFVHVTSDGEPQMVPWFKNGFTTADRFYSSAEEGLQGVGLLRQNLEHGTVHPNVIQSYQAMVTKANLAATLKAHPLCYPAFLSQARTAK
jgi:ABC-type sugar transport system substrate-binding protein